MARNAPPCRSTTNVFSAACWRRRHRFGESWIDGDWHSDQPAELLTVLADNRRRWRMPCTAAGCRARTPTAPPAAQQYRRRVEAQHPRPLRSRQRLLRAVAGFDHELFVRTLWFRPATVAGAGARPSTTGCWRARPQAERDCSGDRLRLGRLCGNRGANSGNVTASPCHRRNSNGRRRWRPAATRRAQRLSPAGLPRHPRGISTTSSPSRCSRRSASVTGPATFAPCALPQTGRARRIQTITIADDRFERYRTHGFHPAAHLSRRHAGLARGV